MTLVGRVGGVIEQSLSQKGDPYIKYPIVVRTGKDTSSWFNVVTFDAKTVDFMTEYVEKGSLVYVEADASIRKYEVDGQTRTSLNLIQQSINPLTWPKRVEAVSEADAENEAEVASEGAAPLS